MHRDPTPQRQHLSPLVTLLALLGLVLPMTLAVQAAVLDVTAPPYNAVGNGVINDRAAIQQAIDDASASAGADTVFLPVGTYLLADRAPGRGLDPSNARTALLWLGSDITIEGAGATSVLLVGPGLNNCNPLGLPRTGGFSVLEGLHNVANNDIVLRNFAIDGNAANNPLPDPDIPGCSTTPKDPEAPPGTPGSANFNRAGRFVTVRIGSRIVVEDCHFKNSNSRQIVHLGDNVNPAVVSDIQILNNTFTDHDLATMHKQGDHSSIYSVATTSGLVSNQVNGNSFINAPGSNGSLEATALEIHGSNTRVEDNFVRNYRLGANVVASITDSVGNVFYNNDFRAVSAGFHLWSVPPFELKNTTIEANRVEQAFVTPGDSLIDWKVAFSPIRNLMIKDNTLTSTVVGVEEESRRGAGISIQGYTHDAAIIGNIISRTECQGIRIAGPGPVPRFLLGQVDPAADALSGTSWVDGLVIQGNIIRDPGSWGATGPGCAVGVSVLSPDTPTGYTVRDIQMTSTPTTINRIRYVSNINNQPSAFAGVRLFGPIDDSTFEGIQILDKIDSDFVTPSLVNLDNVLIDHHDLSNSASPVSQQIRACAGSQWKTSLGVVWFKPSTASCNLSSDWKTTLSGGL